MKKTVFSALLVAVGVGLGGVAGAVASGAGSGETNAEQTDPAGSELTVRELTDGSIEVGLADGEKQTFPEFREVPLDQPIVTLNEAGRELEGVSTGFVTAADMVGRTENLDPDEAAEATRRRIDENGEIRIPIYAADKTTQIGTLAIGRIEMSAESK